MRNYLPSLGLALLISAAGGLMGLNTLLDVPAEALIIVDQLQHRPELTLILLCALMSAGLGTWFIATAKSAAWT